MGEKKFAIITGASRGIGLAVAKYFVKNNYDIAMIARNTHTLEQEKSNLQKLNSESEINIHSIDVAKLKII